MNEELKREVINILRTMKDGTPDSFQFLIEQRVLYFYAQVLFGVACIVCSYILYRIARAAAIKSEMAKYENDRTMLAIAAIFIGLWSVVAMIRAMICLSYLPEAIAPMGRVLEILK